MKEKKESLRKQKSGKLKNVLLKQIMGNQRGKMQSEYSGQYNLSSSLYFQVMDKVLRGKEEDENVLMENKNLYNSLNPYHQDNENETGMMKIFRGLDQIPGKTFTQSQHYFRHNQVNRNNE